LEDFGEKALNVQLEEEVCIHCEGEPIPERSSCDSMQNSVYPTIHPSVARLIVLKSAISVRGTRESHARNIHSSAEFAKNIHHYFGWRALNPLKTLDAKRVHSECPSIHSSQSLPRRRSMSY